jgi:hypothetical protein
MEALNGDVSLQAQSEEIFQKSFFVLFLVTDFRVGNISNKNLQLKRNLDH